MNTWYSTARKASKSKASASSRPQLHLVLVLSRWAEALYSPLFYSVLYLCNLVLIMYANALKPRRKQHSTAQEREDISSDVLFSFSYFFGLH